MVVARLARRLDIAYTLDMPRAKKSRKKPTPRKQHPFLVGCTHAEAEFLARAAEAGDEGPITFIRESAMMRASKRLGEVAPVGE